MACSPAVAVGNSDQLERKHQAYRKVIHLSGQSLLGIAFARIARQYAIGRCLQEIGQETLLGPPRRRTSIGTGRRKRAQIAACLAIWCCTPVYRSSGWSRLR
jgi:hypothetical protein